MGLLRFTGIVAAATLLAGSLCAQGQGQQPPRKKRVLVIGEVKGFQHDSVSYAMAKVWNWGKETGLWDTYLRSDSQLVTKEKLKGNAKNLDFFDAVVFYTTGELPMNDEQKAALLSFVKEDGKGFIGIHSATDTFYQWPEYGEMIGGWFDAHPWNTFEAPILVEDKGHPATKHMPDSFTMRDEIYQFKNLLARQTAGADAAGREEARSEEQERPADRSGLRRDVGEELWQGPGVLFDAGTCGGSLREPAGEADVHRGDQVGAGAGGRAHESSSEAGD